jgi:regulator of sirC expression with transglutaminase-like and TPR domain
MDVVRSFAELVRRPEAELDLAEGALLIARAADPDLEPARPLARLDEMAAGVSDLVGLCRRLFVELGFRGDSRNYYSPANSFLHRVIERRRGIPITLSLVTMEVGRRAGVRLEPIGMPAHFLVRDPETGLYIDSFGATVLDDRECEALFRDVTGAGPDVPFGPELRPVVGPRDILARMLGNLAEVYRLNAEAANLEWVLRMRLAIPGGPTADAVQLAHAVAAQGRVREASRELEERAAASTAEAPALLAAARGLRARLN